MSSKKLSCAFYGVTSDMAVYFKKKLKNLKCSFHEEELNLENLNKNAEVLVVFVGSKVNEKVLEKMPKVKLITTMSTGFDHVDIKLAKKKGVLVSNVPSYGENTVAEHAMALILAISRQLFSSVKRVKEGQFDFHGLRGFDLKNKTLGVVGTGKIGRHLINMAKGFEMNILAYDLYPNKELEKNGFCQYVSLDNLLKNSDIISLHAPLTPETHHLLNKQKFRKIKKGAYLVNTARGGLLDGEALLAALNSGQIAGAGLDVLEDEEFIEHHEELFSKKSESARMRLGLINNMLIDHPRVIVTPHNAFNSKEALERIMDTTIENILGFIKNKPSNIIN